MQKQRTKRQREAGILMPVSSLPSAYGIGSLGQEAKNWIDFLHDAGQGYWQVLPLGPTSYGDSPYQSFSAFAGNPYFIDLDLLCAKGLLTQQECEGIQWAQKSDKVDYATLFNYREPLIRKAFARFNNPAVLEEFKEKNIFWIEDYALYMAVKDKMGLRAWNEWDEDVRMRKPETLQKYRESLREDILFYIFVQYLFFEQWEELRAYAHKKGVKIIGDIPIYVAQDSADVWANNDLFILDKSGTPIEVSGCPPDSFSADGQLWGNPLYKWDTHKKTGYAWWMQRMRANFAMYDVLRIDHFRGLESYYAIPHGNENAVYGEWKKGPGMDFVNAVRAEMPQAEIIAEDLGFLTDEVRQLLKDSTYPGMKVLQFAFDTREESDYSPYNYGNNSVVYTGTHDNETICGWIKTAPKDDVAHAMAYMGVRRPRKDGAMGFIRLALQSTPYLAVVPLQDWLELGSNARMNTPATIGGNNWRWRVQKKMITPQLAAKIKENTKLYGRYHPLP